MCASWRTVIFSFLLNCNFDQISRDVKTNSITIYTYFSCDYDVALVYLGLVLYRQCLLHLPPSLCLRRRWENWQQVWWMTSSSTLPLHLHPSFSSSLHPSPLALLIPSMHNTASPGQAGTGEARPRNKALPAARMPSPRAPVLQGECSLLGRGC